MRQDLLYALRSMARNPGISAVAVITLALGIGANTAMFSVIYAVLLRPLPFPEPGRLVTILSQVPHLNIFSGFVEYNTFGEWWRARSRSFDAMSAYTHASGNLTSGDQPQRVKMLRVTANYLAVLGARPSLGRDFLAAEDQPGAAHAAILSDGLWKRRFGGDRGVLGRAIVIDQESYTVVGVMGPEFDFNTEDLFTPIAQSTARAPGEPTVGVYARLKPGVTVEAAQAEIDSQCRGWVRQYRYPMDWGGRVWQIEAYRVRDVRSSILVLAAAVALVLLIACANVANVLLARASAREREMAIRSSLGAGRGRIVRQLLTESAVLGASAAGLGLLIAAISVRALGLAEASMPFLRKVSVNGPVLAFTAAAALATTMLFGLAPAIAAAHTSLTGSLREGSAGTGEGRRRNRFRAGLVIVEIALALLLGIGATLTIRGLGRLQAVNPGFRAEGVLTAEVVLPQASYPDPAKRAGFFKVLLERVAAIPGVRAAGMVSQLPFGGSKSGHEVVAEGAPPPRPGDELIAFTRTVDPDYFRTLETPLAHGRFFTARDGAGPRVAIINQTMARRLFPQQDAIGKRFGAGRPDAWFTVAGITADMRNSSLDADPDSEYFAPHALLPSPAMTLVVRTELDPLRLASALRAAVRELDKDLPVSDVGTLAANVARSTGTRRFSAKLLGGFALLALALAAVGIYGVVSYSVTRRTHEIGLRIALGAAPRRIAAMVVGQALLLGAAGVGLGIGGSLALTRLLRTTLYGISATDPAVFTAAALFLLTVCGLAAYLPARRAAQVDPLIALRHE